MNTKKHKSEKINSVVHQNERSLNLHEIKKQTGAGNGHRHSEDVIKNETKVQNSKNLNKSDHIHSVVHENERNLNLHEIKKQTGAGNGHRHSNKVSANNEIKEQDSKNLNKSDHIHSVVHGNDRNLNLHEIKKQTGAGNGHKHNK